MARITIRTRFILYPDLNFSEIAVRTANYQSHLNDSWGGKVTERLGNRKAAGLDTRTRAIDWMSGKVRSLFDDRGDASASAPQEVHLVCPVHFPSFVSERNQSTD